MLDLSIFCEPSEYSRYPGLAKPFRSGEWIYATDGRICVRRPADEQAEAIGKVPKVDELFREFNAEACTEPWPRWNGETDVPGGKIAMQTIAGRSILGLHWFKIWWLGKVFYDWTGTKADRIHFVSGDLQGILMPR